MSCTPIGSEDCALAPSPSPAHPARSKIKMAERDVSFIWEAQRLNGRAGFCEQLIGLQIEKGFELGAVAQYAQFGFSAAGGDGGGEVGKILDRLPGERN